MTVEQVFSFRYRYHHVAEREAPQHTDISGSFLLNKQFSIRSDILKLLSSVVPFYSQRRASRMLLYEVGFCASDEADVVFGYELREPRCFCDRSLFVQRYAMSSVGKMFLVLVLCESSRRSCPHISSRIKDIMAQALRHCRTEPPAARLGERNGEVCETMRRHAKRSAERFSRCHN